jgi:hypothetical protein
MSKNASNDFDPTLKIGRISDNPQEMLKKDFYFSGLIAAEMSCSIIKAKNKKPHDHYYMVDLTVTNADRRLLDEVNRVVMNNRGVISPVKGAYNLSARGKSKVRTALDFLETYPIPIGDLAKNRIILLKTALVYLESHRAHRFQKEKTIEIEGIRRKLREVKTKGIVDQKFDLHSLDNESLGYFIAGVIDGEGSFGIKSSGLVKEPFFMIAMKDKKIIDLISKFVNYGNVRLRKDGVYHLEINSRAILKKVCEMFLNQYPLRHERQRKRLILLQQLLNDYTPRSPNRAGSENVI